MEAPLRTLPLPLPLPLPLADALMARAQAGDADAFAVLYRSYAPEIAGYTRSRLPAAAAEDTAAGVWARAWAKRHTYQPQAQGGVRAWLFRIAAHLTIDTWRAARKAPLLFSTAAGGGASVAGHVEHTGAALDAFFTTHGVAPVPDPASAAAERLTLQPAVAAALDQLTPPQRAVLRLRWFEDRSVRDTGRRLGLSDDAVKQTQARAFARLRQALLPFAPGTPAKRRPS